MYLKGANLEQILLPIIKTIKEYIIEARKADAYSSVVGLFCVYCNDAKIKWNLPMFHSYKHDKGEKFGVTDKELDRWRKHFNIFTALSAVDDPTMEKILLDELNDYETYKEKVL